jgi:hypothetical protein
VRPFTIQWQRGRPVTVRLRWRPARNEFTLDVSSMGENESKVLNYDIFGFPDPEPDAVTPTKFIRVRTRAVNCRTGKPVGAIRATVDDVQTNDLTPQAAEVAE